MWWETVLSLLGLVLATVFVLFLAWFVLRILQNGKIPGTTGTNRPIKIIDRVQLGKSGNIMLVRVKEKVFLIAMNEHYAETIYEFEDPNEEISFNSAGQNPGFAQAMKDAMKKLGKKQDGGTAGTKGEDEDK